MKDGFVQDKPFFLSLYITLQTLLIPSWKKYNFVEVFNHKSGQIFKGDGHATNNKLNNICVILKQTWYINIKRKKYFFSDLFNFERRFLSCRYAD